MTVKQFTTKGIICSSYCVWDSDDKPYGNDEVVELLNELHEENQALKERRHEDINDLSVIAMKYKALEEENKELKEEIRMLNELLGERELAEYRRKEYDEFWARKKRIMGL